SDLIAEALHHDRPVRRHHAGGLLLLAEELDQVAGRALVQVVLALQNLWRLVHRPAGEGADRLAQLTGTPYGVALPEWDRSGQAGGGGDDHPVSADLLDPPGGGAEQERLARPRLVDHLLVELADASAGVQGRGVQAAVGEGAGVGDGKLAGPVASANRARH